MPLDILAALPLLVLCKYANEEYASELSGALYSRLQSLDDRDSKDYSPQVRKSLFRTLQELRVSTPLKLSILQLSISHCMLTSAVLERRIKGLQEIRDMAETAADSSWTADTRRITKSQVLNWVLERRVVDVLTGERAHHELLRRGKWLFELLAEKGKLTKAHTTALWRSVNGRHESYVRAVFEVLATLPAYLGAADTRELYDTISTGAANSDETYLQLLTDFSVTAMRERKSSECYAGEMLFLRALEHCDEAALSCLVRLLPYCRAQSLRDSFFTRAVQSIAHDHSVPQSLSVLFAVLKPLAKSEQRDLVRRAMKISPLTVLATTSVNKYVEVTRRMGITADVVTADNTLHSKNMEVRFRLLSLLRDLDFKFEETSIEVLWMYTVTCPILPTDCRLMYSWLIDRVNAKSLSPASVLALFSKGFHTAAATMESFRTFRHMFLAANHAAKCLEVSGLTVIARRSGRLEAFDTLLEFATVATDSKVNECAAALVVDCLVMLDSQVSQKVVWEEVRRKLLSLFREQSGRTLQLCHALLELKCAPVELCPGAGRVSVHLRLPEFCSERVALPNTAVVSELRQHAGFLLSVHHSKVRLSRFAHELPPTDDSTPITKLAESAVPVTVELCGSVADSIQPAALLACEDLYQCLLHLAADSRFAQVAWDALMKFPRSATLVKQLQRMETSALDIGSYGSFPKMLYTLIAIAELGRLEGFANRFFRSKEGQRVVTKAFKINVLRLSCSGAQTAKYMEVLSHLASQCSRQVLPARLILHQSLNSLFSLSTRPTKGCQSAISLLRSMLEACYSEESRSEFVASLAAHWRVRDVLLNGLVRTTLEEVRKEVKEWVVQLSNKPFALGEVMLWNAIEILPAALSEGAPLSFFSLLKSLIQFAPPHFSERLSDVCGTLLSFLQYQHQSPTPSPHSITGSLGLLRKIIAALHLVPSETSFEVVLTDYLFSDKPLCREAYARNAGLKLLVSMLQLSYREYIVKRINAQFLNAEWRSARVSDWRVKGIPNRRPAGAYIGIRNTGWICYVISVLQQLYMMPQVRADLLSLEAVDEGSAARQCQVLFAKLAYTEKPHIGLQRLCDCLESSVNISEQMDAEEFLNAFLSRLERELGPNRALLLDHFEGLLYTETVGDCQHKGRSSERFLTLPLVVKNKKDVYESLDCLVQGETIQGENAYLCDQCDKKVSARRKVGIGHLPNTLLIVLRRFDFNLDTNQRQKLHDYYEFPFDLDLSRYILEAQRTQAVPSDYYTYRLRGIVVHTGDAEGGHYYSFIQDRGTLKWMRFNDSKVTDIDAGKILDEAFGGFYSGENVEKVSSAYMLIYEREGKYEVRSDVFSELKRVNSSDIAVSQSAQAIVQRITEKSQKVWSRRNTFSHEFADFVCSLLTTLGDRLEVYQLAASYFFTVTCRSEDRYALTPLFTNLQNARNRNSATDYWMLETLTSPYVALELLVGCPHSAIRKLVIALARTASQSVPPGQKSVCLERLLSALPYVRQQPTHYFELMHVVATGCELKPEWRLEERLVCYVLNRQIEEVASTAATDDSTTLGYCNFPPPLSHFTPSDDPCNTSIGGLLATLAEVQIQYREFYITREFISAVMPALSGKTAATQAARFFSLLTSNDERGSLSLLSALFVDIEKAEYEHLKLLLRVVGKLLVSNDSVASDRCAAALTVLSKAMYTNRESIQFVSTVGLALARWNLRNPLVCSWMSANYTEFTHWLLIWIDEVSTICSGPDALDLNVIKKLRSLSVRSTPATLEDWDSDSEVDFASTGRVRRYNGVTKSWEFFVVLDNFGEVARAKFDRGVERIVWIESDEEALTPIGKP